MSAATTDFTNHATQNGVAPELDQATQDQTTQDLPPDADAAQDALEQTEDDLAALLAQTQAQIADLQEALLRARAEGENIRRRAAEDVTRARKFGIESFAESLVPVKDSLEAALAHADQSPEAWKEGVEGTLRQLTSAFERNALKDIAPAPGDKFDPHQHQAISSVPSEHAEGCVAQLLQKGYTIAERVLRPALVMVSAGQTAPAEAPATP